MRRTMTTRILCMILALCTVFTMVPMAMATEAEEPVVTEPVLETQPLETEPVEAEPEEIIPEEVAPEETVPEETVPEEIIPEETVPEETVPEEPVAEETVPEDAELLPFDLSVLPEGFVLSEAALEAKSDLVKYSVTDAVAMGTPGETFVSDEILVGAETLEEAELFAAVYRGYLKEYRYGVAVIGLDGISVADAVAASADMSLALPAAYPNEIISLNPVEDKDTLGDDPLLALAEVPSRLEWADWVKDTMLNPDPFLLNPDTNNNYQENAYHWMHDTVDTYAAWGITTGNPWVKVAVIDTGVNSSHEELAGRVTHIKVSNSLGTADDNGHGTHVAGIIAASMNNGKGGAGIAPGVSIMSLKVLNSKGSGNTNDIMNALYLAADNGAWIINMSLGGYIYNAYYQNAVNYAVNRGATVIVAMGNNSTNLKCYPAAFSNVVAVGASEETNNRAYFSNWGAWQDVSAPGMHMWSSSYWSSNAYERMNGTSQATPVVSGLAALYMSANGKVSPATMEKVLKDSCVKGGANLGKGIVNAANMFSKSKPVVDYSIYNEWGVECKGKTVPSDTWMDLWANPTFDDQGMIIYTINGKTPSIKNGEIVNGDIYYSPIDLFAFAGKSLTIKAVAVNGLGIAGPVKTIKVKVDTSSTITEVSVEGPSTLVAGKSGTYTATVEPVGYVSQSVTWSIVENVGMSSAKISSSGKLTTSSKQEGYVVIRATSKTDSRKYAQMVVHTQKIKPVASMSLNTKTATLTLGTGKAADAKIRLSIATMLDASKVPVDPKVSGVKWTSSKETVATVDQNGNVVAVGPGSATITCKTLDGSGKSATCKVTVKQWVGSIEVTGNPSMAPGSSATYKAVCAPTNASSKSVTWSLIDAPAGTKVDSKGKVTLPKSASSYMYYTFQVVATAKDGSGVTGRASVKIRPKCTGLNMQYSGHDYDLVKLKSNGYVSSAVLYTVENDYYSGDDTTITLKAVGTNVTPIIKWSSSKPSVATVDENGKVTAVKAGSTTITATAQDGSGKKASVTITVKNPVSSLSITTTAPRAFGEDAYLAFGKSATNKVSFGDTYGAPSNKAVSWSYRLLEVNENMAIINDWSYYAQSKKWISLSSSGKLTVSSKLKSEFNYMSGDLVLLVTATAKDDPSVSDTQGYWLIPAATYMRKGYLIGSTFYTDKSTVWISKNSTYRNSSDNVVTLMCDMYRPQKERWLFEMTATSSNPDVVGVELIEPHISSNGQYYYKEIFYLGLVGGNKTGSAKITVKAGDGSGKSCTFNVKVY